MAIGRIHSWSSGEILYASDLNAEINNILNNASSLISPLTQTLDAANHVILDVSPLIAGYTTALLPAAGASGRIVRRTDVTRGLMMDNGTSFFSLGLEMANIREFGATGDGSTDDSTAITAALATLSSGGTLLCPAGTYYRSSASPVMSITTSNINVVGAGIGVTIFKQGGAGDGIDITGADGVGLYSLSVVGNDTGAKGIAISNGRDVAIQRVNVSGFLNNAVDASGTSYHGVLRDSRITAGNGATGTAAMLLGAGATSWRADNSWFNVGGSVGATRYASCVDCSDATFDQFTSIGCIYDGAPIGIKSRGKFVDLGGYFDPSSSSGVWSHHVTIEANNGAAVLCPRSFDPDSVGYSGSGSISNLTHFGGGNTTAILAGQPLGVSTTPTQISSNQNDYYPPNGNIYGTWRLSADAARDITGILAGVDGRWLFLWNVGTQTITLKNNSGSSSAANRFLPTSGADVALTANAGVWAFYDGTTPAWRVKV